MNPLNASRRTLQPVRRDSKPVGSFEATFWRPTDAREMRVAMKAAERFDDARKRKGARNGPLGYTGLKVFKALWRAIRFRDGCLCPSYDWLMRKTRLSRQAVADALKRLKAAGFVSWRRRLEYTGDVGGRGRAVRQATNAYVLGTPAEALAYLGQTIVPADAITRIRERAAFVLACDRAAFDDSRLGAAVAALGSALLAKPSLRARVNPSSGLLS